MITLNLIDSSIAKGFLTKYFDHYKTNEENKSDIWNDPFYNAFLESIEELSKNENFISD